LPISHLRNGWAGLAPRQPVPDAVRGARGAADGAGRSGTLTGQIRRASGLSVPSTDGAGRSGTLTSDPLPVNRYVSAHGADDESPRPAIS